jgi:hypothetical protein
MYALADTPHLPAMGDDRAARGQEIKRRFKALDITDREWHKRTGIDRKTLNRAIAGVPTVRTSTYDAIESNLDKLEARLQGRVPPTSEGLTIVPDKDPATPGLIRFRVQGAYGFDALVVEGPVENVAELVASVQEIMRGLQNGENSQD